MMLYGRNLLLLCQNALAMCIPWCRDYRVTILLLPELTLVAFL